MIVTVYAVCAFESYNKVNSMPVNEDQLRLIDTQKDLDDLCTNISSARHIGCDTEFVRTQTYWPQLCLIQIATETKSACIDVLASFDMSEFRRLMLAHPEPLILHAVKQDLEAWFATWQELPKAVFDIQIAAGLLGFQPQIGYGNLVRELLDITLDKDQTRTDWSRRPLTNAQISYATDDVNYLHQLHDITRTRLEDCGRYDWALADSADLVKQSLYDSPPQDAWQRLSGIPYLPVAVQARARALATWRETRAKKSDRPRQWILTDKALLQIAHANPERTDDLHHLAELPPGLVRKQGGNFLQTVRQANDDLANGATDLTQKPVPVPPDKKKIQKLAGIVRETAQELNVAPELLATRRDITGILNGQEDCRVLKGWRRGVIGDKLLAAC
jgi:ribonuclease D